MKVFFDTEFADVPASSTGKAHISLISVGLVRDDGAELYMENAKFQWRGADAWLIENVQPHLQGKSSKETWCTPEQMSITLTEWLADVKKPQFIAYVGAYDWVALMSVFGPLLQRPEGWPIWCRDIKAALEHTGFDKELLPVQQGSAHNALEDARWNLQAWHAIYNTVPNSNVVTWEDALEYFPCSHCENSSGLIREAHTIDGAEYGVCLHCQAPSVVARFTCFRGGYAPFEVATRMIDNRFPLRFVVKPDKEDITVVDLLTSQEIWRGDLLASMEHTEQLIASENLRWWNTLQRRPPAVQALLMP